MKKYSIFLLIISSFALYAQELTQTDDKHVKPSLSEDRNSIRTEWAPFYHGVASGDPLADRVIIWTRVTPDNNGGDPIEVEWRIAKDTSMYDIVNQGTYTANETRDYTVKVDVDNLEPSTCYYFDFKVGNDYSVRGRAITADVGDNDHVRFAVVSCSNYEYGYFNAYRAIADRNDINAVLHLGDYIYEYEVGGYSANIADRDHEPEHEIVTLDDYRLRYSHYRLDHDLQAVHQQYPFICVWDDHESANDSYVDGAENHDETTQGNWQIRKNNSKQAYFEWMPIRENPGDSAIYRLIEYGDLINLYMLDTRLEGRDEQVGASSTELNNPDRTLLGEDQLEWLKNGLLNSTKQWNILGQQVMMAPLLAFGVPVNTDQWDGYPVERANILNHIMNNDIENIVVLTGDIHTSWAIDIPLNGYDASTGNNSAGVEFVTTSITSPGFDLGVGGGLIQSFNPHVKYVNLNRRGYIVLDVNKERTQAEWYHVDNITTTTYTENLANAFYVNSGERHNRTASLTSVAQWNCIPAPKKPWDINNYLSINEEPKEDLLIFGVYPNPFDTEIIIHLGSTHEKNAVVKIYDTSGKLVFEQQNLKLKGNSEYLKIYTNSLKQGTYTLIVSSNNISKSYKIIKQ
jgi:alkaline phosphatase D